MMSMLGQVSSCWISENFTRNQINASYNEKLKMKHANHLNNYVHMLAVGTTV